MPTDATRWALNDEVRKRDRAYKAVRRALRAGRLQRPEQCQVCGDPASRGSDGRTLLQAHHDDYARPLDVKWCCPTCHRAQTPLAAVGPRSGAYTRPDRVRRGTAHGRAKLTEDDVRRMRELAATSHLSAYQLGRLFNVNGKTALTCIRRQTWKSLA